jgi:peptidylprolyl isomerase
MFTPLRVSIVAIALGIIAAVVISCRAPSSPPEEQLAEAQPPAPPTSQPAMTLADGPRTVTPSGLTIIETQPGTGPAAKPGDTVEMNYRGRLYYGGKQFDSSYDRGQTFQFRIGAQMVIPGFDEGATGLKVGGKRELLIPPDIGYGPAGSGPIPPNATLVFDIELMKID